MLSDERKAALTAMWENESIDTMVDLFADAESGIDVGYSDEEMDFIE